MNNNYERNTNHNNKEINSVKVRIEPLPSSLMPPSKKTNIIINKNIKDEDVYDLLRKIPAGKVSTYGDLAKAIGKPSYSRIIGRILGKNPNPIEVPCHRVVMSDGKLGGYAYGMERKKELLQDEGVSFIDGMTVDDFENIRFCPQTTQTTEDISKTNECQ
jgi:methylated-DNA-[protein]-cysteine S-methyltransferase